MHANIVNISRFYHVLTIQKNSDNDRKLYVFKQQHVYLQNKHGKGYTCLFIETKDTKTYSK